MTVQDWSKQHEEAELRKGPPRMIVRFCTGGVGDATVPGYTYTEKPEKFLCMSSSQYCSNDEPVGARCD